ncbi:MAG TPA: phospho-N-acetylmuramoyl-pentapeptide-transferase [Candidatus Saccharimonadales bacterium]|nr:phospho-N-acetylmuramoyl-pentapeptide-transferase [Candidatus Saccharimonadales bacterium]
MTFLHNTEIVPLSHIFIMFILTFAVAMILTPLYTDLAYRYKWWRRPRENAVTGEAAPVYQSLHAGKHKRNIPTMAGIIMIVAVALVTVVLNLDRNQTWLPLAMLVIFGALGLVDDISNLFFSDKRGGLSVKTQLLALIGLAIIGASWFYFKLGYNLIHVPAVGDFSIGWLYIPLFVLVVVSCAKSISITDGLDGLAGGLLSVVFGAYGVIAYFQGSYGIAGFCAALVGAIMAFTWFNIFPARFFMGQTGSTALGATLGAVAMLTNAVFVLPIIGAVFVIEAGSSLIQITSKKVFKRKIFLSAPLHHHLEAIGWPETKVTMRLWVVGQIAAAIGLVLGLLGNHLR